MLKKSAIFFIFFLITSNINAKEIKVINLKTLKNIIKNEYLPKKEQINLAVQNVILMNEQNKEKYSLLLNGSVNKFSDNDDIDITMYNTGISKQFASGFGINSGIGNSINFGSSNIYLDNTKDFNVTFSMDLRKNFLGYTDLAKILSLELSKKQSEIKAKIDINDLIINIEKLYWSIIFKEKEIEVYNILVEQAKKNLENIIKKEKSYIADKGDVAKIKSELYNRVSILDNLKNSKIILLQQLTTIIPQLNNFDLQFEDININNVLKNIKEINNSILADKNAKNNSLYYDYIDLIDRQISEELKSIERYSDIDIKLSVGTNIRTDNSQYNGANIRKNDYFIGLNFNLPLDNKKSNSKEIQLKLARMNHNLNKNNILSIIDANFNYYQIGMEQLFNVLNNKIKLKDQMQIRVDYMRNKYNQGRISLADLIQDEDTLIQANITLLQSQNNIINRFLDYCLIFNKNN